MARGCKRHVLYCFFSLVSSFFIIFLYFSCFFMFFLFRFKVPSRCLILSRKTEWSPAGIKSNTKGMIWYSVHFCSTLSNAHHALDILGPSQNQFDRRTTSMGYHRWSSECSHTVVVTGCDWPKRRAICKSEVGSFRLHFPIMIVPLSFSRTNRERAWESRVSNPFTVWLCWS